MKQAKVLTVAERKRLLAVIAKDMGGRYDRGPCTRSRRPIGLPPVLVAVDTRKNGASVT